MLRKVPLIVVLGSTGTGKTKLSIELAQRFGGEVISADSMQVYADLDIVTAKATREEQQTVPHHLLDVAKPSEPFTVKHFRALAAPIIDDLLSASKYPIVVGGTNYYIESLLWDILVGPPPLSSLSGPDEDDALRKRTERKEAGTTENRSMSTRSGSNSPVITMMQSDENDGAAKDEGSGSEEIGDLELETMSPSELHERLKQVDPISAGRLHPNNKRKILRSGNSGVQWVLMKMDEESCLFSASAAYFRHLFGAPAPNIAHKSMSYISLHLRIPHHFRSSKVNFASDGNIICITDCKGKAQLPRHYLFFPDGFILVYDPTDTSSLDMLADIDKNKEKKEVCIIVLANMRSKAVSKKSESPAASPVASNQLDPVEAVLSRANNWCARERIKHYTVNAMERASLYEPFINLTARLHPPQTKSVFPQLRQVMQKSTKSDS